MKNNINVKAVALATLVAGTLDLAGAIIVYALLLKVVSVTRLLQSIAAGVTGTAAYEGGIKTAAAGAGLHFFISFCWVMIYLVLYPALSRLTSNDILKGILYGCFVWES